VRQSGRATRRGRRARDTRISGVDFEPHIDRLLALASVVDTEDAWVNLNNCLVMAGACWDLDLESKKMRIPAEHLNKLEASIRKTQSLLRNSEKYLGSERIRFIRCPVGEGTVATQTFEPGKWGQTVPFPSDPLPPLGISVERVPPGGMIASINIQRTLGRMLREIARAKRSGGRPREEGKSSIVSYAALFFREHCTGAVTPNPSGQFATFCRSFYEAVTGARHLDRDDLQIHIKAEVKKPTFQI
jgi:hypothetical protein